MSQDGSCTSTPVGPFAAGKDSDESAQGYLCHSQMSLGFLEEGRKKPLTGLPPLDDSPNQGIQRDNQGTHGDRSMTGNEGAEVEAGGEVEGFRSGRGKTGGGEGGENREVRADAQTEGQRGSAVVEDEYEGPQKQFITWVQRRQREFVTVISFVCVTVYFVKDLSSNDPNLSMTLIPVAVHVLLIWDIWMKWGRPSKPGAADVSPGQKYTTSVTPISTASAAHQGKSRQGGRNSATGVGNPQRGSSLGTSTEDSDSSYFPEDPCIISPGEKRGSRGAEAQDREGGHGHLLSSTQDQTQEDMFMKALETPFQKSLKLLSSASRNISDPHVRRQLHKVAKMLADPDALHIVKDTSIRRLPLDQGTRSYIENVLQTPGGGSFSANTNWQKLRAGLLVVQAMSMTQDEEGGSRDDTEDLEALSLDDEDQLAMMRLEDDDGESMNENSKVSPLNSVWEMLGGQGFEDHGPVFLEMNAALVHSQQMMGKLVSRSDPSRDPDRITVQELRDLVDENRPVAGTAPTGDSGESGIQGQQERAQILRLPILSEGDTESVASLMSNNAFLRWEFDVFQLEEKSKGHSLWFAAMSVFLYYNLIGAFGISPERLSAMFTAVEQNYCYRLNCPNSYHTHVHAADVTLTVAHFLSMDALTRMVKSSHALALLMAAIMHDYRHPGVNNGYLVRRLDPLAVMYNDTSVLENFHTAEGFKMMLHARFDIFRGWKSEDLRVFRNAYVKCILATDLALSFQYISKFQMLSKTSSSHSGGTSPQGETSHQSPTILLQMVLKVADVAHPSKPWPLHRRWSDLVTEEFFRQGDLELSQGLPVSPLCDRREKNLPKSQCDFIEFIVRPCLNILSDYCQVSVWNNQLNANFKEWKKLHEAQGGPVGTMGVKRRSVQGMWQT